MKHRIDLMSKKILTQISQNAGFDIEAIAEAVGCAPAVVEDRIAKLQEDGVIRGFRAHVDLSAVNGHHEALVVGIPTHETDPQALRRLSKEADVARVYTMASQASVAFHIHGKDADALEARAKELADIAGLRAFRCTLVVSSLDGQASAPVLPITA